MFAKTPLALANDCRRGGYTEAADMILTLQRRLVGALTRDSVDRLFAPCTCDGENICQHCKNLMSDER
jgi:hypothetical protein